MSPQPEEETSALGRAVLFFIEIDEVITHNNNLLKQCDTSSRLDRVSTNNVNNLFYTTAIVFTYHRSTSNSTGNFALVD